MELIPHETPDTTPTQRARESDGMNLSPTTRTGLADVHLHTNYSDGTGSVEEVLYFAQHHTSLDVIAVTDHDTIEGALRARELAARNKYRFTLTLAHTITTRQRHLLPPH